MNTYFAILIAYLPFNILRVFFYNKVLGYNISYSSKIGLGTVIAIRRFQMENSSLGRNNRMKGKFTLHIKSGTNIGNNNEFVCTSGSSSIAYCKIGNNVHITNDHFFDSSGGLELGSYTRIAGRGSQFWTHGGQRKETKIVINEKCYIGSAVRISQGVTIQENSFIGLGSVVVDSFDAPNVLIFGHPAKIVKTGIVARKSLEEKS